MTKAKKNSVIAVLLSLTMVFTLVLGVLPNDAHAVTQAEIDALQAQKDALTAQRQEKQDIVDELESQHATVLEQKLAMDARNQFTQQQIDLTNNQIELYGQMIEDKKLEGQAERASRRAGRATGTDRRGYRAYRPDRGRYGEPPRRV